MGKIKVEFLGNVLTSQGKKRKGDKILFEEEEARKLQSMSLVKSAEVKKSGNSQRPDKK